MCVEMVRRAPYVSLLNITSPRLIFPPPYPSQPSLSQLEHCIMRITKVQRSCEVVRSERTEPETGGAVRNELPRAFAIVGSGLVAFYCLAPTAVGAQNRLVETSALDVVTVHDSVRREFYFTRAVYSDLRTRFPSWSVDYPKADRQFLIGLQRLTNIDAYAGEHPVRLDDPALREFPILYAVEVGYMALTDSERQGLRDYLLAGGFLIVDDFWGSWEWSTFAREIRAVLPEYAIVDIPANHPVRHVFYDLDHIVQVPNVGQGRSGGPTWEKDGYTPALRGIMNNEGRLMVAIIWNSDLGDAWEWAEDPYYPIRFSNFAYQLGVNLIVYAMSH